MRKQEGFVELVLDTTNLLKKEKVKESCKTYILYKCIKFLVYYIFIRIIFNSEGGDGSRRNSGWSGVGFMNELIEETIGRSQMNTFTLCYFYI